MLDSLPSLSNTVWPHASTLGCSTGCCHQRFAQAILLLPFNVYSALRISSSEWYSNLHQDVWNHICINSITALQSRLSYHKEQSGVVLSFGFRMFSEISSIHGQHVFLSFNFDCGIYSHSTYVHILCAIMDVSCNRCLQIHLLHFCFWRCTVGLIFAPIRLCHGGSAPKAFSAAQLLYICVKVDKGNTV